MTDIDTLLAKLADDTAKLANVAPSNPYLASVHRALRVAALADTPAAKRDHPYQAGSLSGQCEVCGAGTRAKAHRAHVIPPKEVRRRAAAADRKVLAWYKADDEARYQARRRQALAEIDAEAGRA